jgi:hypothetical protein
VLFLNTVNTPITIFFFVECCVKRLKVGMEFKDLTERKGNSGSLRAKVMRIKWVGNQILKLSSPLGLPKKTN